MNKCVLRLKRDISQRKCRVRLIFSPNDVPTSERSHSVVFKHGKRTIRFHYSIMYTKGEIVLNVKCYYYITYDDKSLHSFNRLPSEWNCFYWLLCVISFCIQSNQNEHFSTFGQLELMCFGLLSPGWAWSTTARVTAAATKRRWEA